jgi:hypothetical protein
MAGSKRVIAHFFITLLGGYPGAERRNRWIPARKSTSIRSHFVRS